MITDTEKANQALFFDWIGEEVPSNQRQELYSILKTVCSNIEDFCIECKILKQPLFETTDLNTIEQIQYTVENDETFYSQYGNQIDRMSSAISLYYQFLTEVQTIEHIPADDSSDSSSIADQYKIPGEYMAEYKDVPVDSLPLSVRIINCFKKNGINTLEDMLSTTLKNICKFAGLGRTSLTEIDMFCVKLAEQQIRLVKPSHLRRSFIPPFAIAYYSSIIAGDFSFNTALSKPQRERLKVYQEAYQTLGKDLVQCCVTFPEKISLICSAFYNYSQKVQRDQEIQLFIDQIPAARREKQVIGYIRAFTALEEERELLKSFWHSGTDSFEAILSASSLGNQKSWELLKEFLEWCTFDLSKEIREFFSYLHGKKSTETVLKLRSKKQTLAQIGERLEITRERVRQIEKAVKRHFDHRNAQMRIIPKIIAEQNGQKVLLFSELEEYGGANTQELIFLLRGAGDPDCVYIKQLEAFIIRDASFSKHLQDFWGTLPSIITEAEFPALINDGGTKLGVPEEVLRNAVLNAYKKTGNVYHRGRFSISTLYEKILRKYYSKGIKAYDPKQLEEFRQYIQQDYGEIGVPKNNRALTARIADVGIVCGRGTYISKKGQYIPTDLSDRIYQYIVDSPQVIFLTNTIFAAFEEELSAAGVDNKYYLQGILHELYGSQFTFRRDYISKDPSITSIYASVVEFIKSFHYPVNRVQIKAEFPGISDVVICFAVNDSDVLNLFGGYLHASQLVILEDEQTRLSTLLEQLLSNGTVYHVKDLYVKILHDMPEFITRNVIVAPFGLFSVLEYFFRDQYQFSRPYVGANGIEIGHPAERLHELLYSTDTFSISDIREFVRDNHFQIPSLLEYINACNDRFLLIDSDTAMDIAQIGISEESAHDINEMLSTVVTETIPICHLDIWDKLPLISVPWTDWLLYSVLYKWGTAVSVSTSSQQFRYAIPLASPAGKVNSNAFQNLSRQEATAMFQPDNLDDIDTLLEDIICQEILGDP